MGIKAVKGVVLRMDGCELDCNNVHATKAVNDNLIK